MSAYVLSRALQEEAPVNSSKTTYKYVNQTVFRDGFQLLSSIFPSSLKSPAPPSSTSGTSVGQNASLWILKRRIQQRVPTWRSALTFGEGVARDPQPHQATRACMQMRGMFPNPSRQTRKPTRKHEPVQMTSTQGSHSDSCWNDREVSWRAAPATSTILEATVHFLMPQSGVALAFFLAEVLATSKRRNHRPSGGVSFLLRYGCNKHLSHTQSKRDRTAGFFLGDCFFVLWLALDYSATIYKRIKTAPAGLGSVFAPKPHLVNYS